MAHHIPDEILAEILAPLLQVPDEMFSDTSLRSPFATSSTSISSVLLVSKAWLRVSTPLLYHDVTTENLGRFVKKLRVEGGFGILMHHILKKRRMSPTYPNKFLNNKAVRELLDSLKSCTKKWIKLNTVVLSFSGDCGPARDSFVETLQSCPNLKTVSIPCPIKFSVPPVLLEIAKIPSLQAIDIRFPIERVNSGFLADSRTHPRFNSLLRWAVSQPPPPIRVSPVAPPLADPSFTPMRSAPQTVVDRVWSRVLWFAMVLDPERPHMDIITEYYYIQKLNSLRLIFLLVSKTFHRLALPYLYGYPAFSDEFRARKLSARLADAPTLGAHVREIETRHGICSGMFEDSLDKTNLVPIFSCTPRLTRLVGEGRIPMNWDAFRALAETAGASLVEFTGYRISEPFSPSYSAAIFQNFTALRVLTWNSDLHFSTHPVETPSTALPVLERLDIESSQLFPVLARMELPSLRRVVVSSSVSGCADFLRAHGGKITHLTTRLPTIEGSSVFALCPVLSTLTLRLLDCWGNTIDSWNLTCATEHGSLTKLVLHKYTQCVCRMNCFSSKAKEHGEWGRFFAQTQFSDFPSLREVQCSSCGEWPKTEREISKSPWVKWAEALLDDDIKLTNDGGIQWRPRFKGPGR
ncbi:hypothetical protein B0H10DRAFT_2026771 [Mycena sp. CBHHK59/15]|nr:hypothetical protein B0H10DRAFT_2026771 [Mycena sp. CBHHK59/15]